MWRKEHKYKQWALEKVYLTDCVLRHKDHLRFLAHIDSDELAILFQHRTLPHLLRDLLDQ